MAAKVRSATVVGVDAVIVEAEAEVTFALRRFSLVGLPDGIVKEAKDRVRCAIQSSGFEFPPGEVVVSLAPAWLPKLGSGFDLAIAVSILAAVGIVPQARLERIVMLGELSLDGSVKPVRGVIQAAIAASRLVPSRYASVRDSVQASGRGPVISDSVVKDTAGLDWAESAAVELAVSPPNAPQAACINGVAAIPVSNLLEAVLYLRGEAEIRPWQPPEEPQKTVSKSGLTFADVVGQHGAKRAMQIAAAGGHNLLMIGPPGAGKSMLAARYPALLPPLSMADSIEVTKIAAVAEFDDSLTVRQSSGGRECAGGEMPGRGSWGLVQRRPFRAPHHSASVAGIIGGGPASLPGEVTLAHRGVLFLDELSEFRREVLESLRQPLEAKRVVVSRARQRITYPADFLLVAAMNPCPCGRRGIPGAGCQCGPADIRSFYRRLSGPIIDRIDLQVWVPPLPPGDLISGEPADDTPQLAQGVAAARMQQNRRFGDGRLNHSMTTVEMKKWCGLGTYCRKLIERASEQRMLSARAISRTIKTARTIADLDGTNEISAEHLAEALNYRLQDFGQGAA